MDAELDWLMGLAGAAAGDGVGDDQALAEIAELDAGGGEGDDQALAEIAELDALAALGERPRQQPRYRQRSWAQQGPEEARCSKALRRSERKLARRLRRTCLVVRSLAENAKKCPAFI